MIQTEHQKHEMGDAPFRTSIPSVPVTQERKPYFPPEGSPLHNAGTARANIAADAQHPHGTVRDNYAHSNQDRTVLQQHCDYWDTDQDGIIWPQDTYAGFRRFGWSLPLSFIAAFVINVGLSYPTCPTFIPDPFFRIYLDKIHKAKHGSDSMTYDNEGRFKPQNFEDIFAKYDQGNKGGLTASDLLSLHMGQRMVFDFFGWTASALEWLATYLLIWPEDGIMKKEDIRTMYDGSLFYRKAEEVASRKQKASPSKIVLEIDLKNE